MNKPSWVIYIIVFLLITSCDQTFEPQKPGAEQNIEVSYKDGIYTEEGDKWEYGNENATVIINKGKIFGITLRRLDNIGREVNYEEWVGEKVNGYIIPDLNKYRFDLAQNMIEKQTYNVEAISGATISSENWKRAVHKALDKASI